MQLSRRLEALAALVPAGSVLADVGTDHAYLPIALCARGQIPSAIAMDVRKGPLARAQRHIVEAKLSARIDVRLSDGLAALAPGEAQTILLAGMGGSLTVRILSAKPAVVRAAETLILQPQSDIGMVRTFCAQSGLVIAAEDMVFEDGKYYPMMRLAHGAPYALSAAQTAFGPCLLAEKNRVLHRYLLWERAQCEKLLDTLSRVENARTKARRTQVAQRSSMIGELLESVFSQENTGKYKADQRKKCHRGSLR